VASLHSSFAVDPACPYDRSKSALAGLTLLGFDSLLLGVSVSGRDRVGGLPFPRAIAGNNTLAKTKMIETTSNNSINVKPRPNFEPAFTT
jgi:hypothetical protein